MLCPGTVVKGAIRPLAGIAMKALWQASRFIVTRAGDAPTPGHPNSLLYLIEP
jgi:hypothetical protein